MTTTTKFYNNKGEEIERVPCEIYTRVMGYHRPVTFYNVGKKSEFYSRIYFKNTNDNFNSEYN